MIDLGFFVVMQHKERRETNKMVTRLVLLAVLTCFAPHNSLVFVVSVHSVSAYFCPRGRGQAQGPPAARIAIRATHVRDNPRSMLCETRSVRI